MATVYTDTLFETKYKDDFNDSDGYYRILFNSGRALQGRELTQMQTIINKQIERFGNNIFKEGSAVKPGGLQIDTTYEFVKFDPSSTSTTVAVGRYSYRCNLWYQSRSSRNSCGSKQRSCYHLCSVRGYDCYFWCYIYT